MNNLQLLDKIGDVRGNCRTALYLNRTMCELLPDEMDMRNCFLDLMGDLLKRTENEINEVMELARTYAPMG